MRRAGEIDEVDTGMGEATFNNLKSIMGGAVDPKFLKAVQEEQSNSGDMHSPQPSSHYTPVKPLQASTATPRKINLPKDVNIENVMSDFYTVHDELVNLFEKVGLETEISQDIINIINGVAKSIEYVGGKIDKFDPYSHVSGLNVPDFVKNAQKVLETTCQCYKAGKIKESLISDDGKTIQIIFTGVFKDIEFETLGSITAKEWVGNEAIDYVYYKGGGKMSVKVFENGRWVNKDNGLYKVTMEFVENVKKNNLPEIKEGKEIVKNNTCQKVEEVSETVVASPRNAQVAVDEDEQEIGDFPITET